MDAERIAEAIVARAAVRGAKKTICPFLGVMVGVLLLLVLVPALITDLPAILF